MSKPTSRRVAVLVTLLGAEILILRWHLSTVGLVVPMASMTLADIAPGFPVLTLAQVHSLEWGRHSP